MILLSVDAALLLSCKPRASGDDPAVNKHEKFIYL